MKSLQATQTREANLETLRDAYRSSPSVKAQLETAAKIYARNETPHHRLIRGDSPEARAAFRQAAQRIAHAIRTPEQRAERSALLAAAQAERLAADAAPRQPGTKTVYRVKVAGKWTDADASAYYEERARVGHDPLTAQRLTVYARDVTHAEAAELYKNDLLRDAAPLWTARTLDPSERPHRTDTSRDASIYDNRHFHGESAADAAALRERIRAAGEYRAAEHRYQEARNTDGLNVSASDFQPPRPQPTRTAAEWSAVLGKNVRVVKAESATAYRWPCDPPQFSPRTLDAADALRRAQLDADAAEVAAHDITDGLTDLGTPNLESGMLSPAEAMARYLATR